MAAALRALTDEDCVRLVQAGMQWDDAGHASDEAAIRRAHAKFLAEYSLAAQEVPLLQLDPGRWDDPFELVLG